MTPAMWGALVMLVCGLVIGFAVGHGIGQDRAEKRRREQMIELSPRSRSLRGRR